MGDEKSFRILFDHYKDRFYWTVYKMTGREEIAEETVQEVFLNIWRQREALTEVKDPDAYFFTIVYRQVYLFYKKQAIEKKGMLAVSETSESRNFTDETILAKESERMIQKAITRLPSQQKRVFELSKLEGLTRVQIAEKLEISPNTVRNHMSEAMKSVQAYLKKVSVFFHLVYCLFLD
jgi:RNA polymerase sigma-70 factor (ECF subfamily)